MIFEVSSLARDISPIEVVSLSIISLARETVCVVPAINWFACLALSAFCPRLANELQAKPANSKTANPRIGKYYRYNMIFTPIV